MNVVRLSPSQVNMFTRCGAAWYFRYVEGLKSPPPSASMVRGKAFHRGLEENYKQKLETHEDLPEDYVMDVYSEVFDLESHIVAWKEGEDPGKMKDVGYAMLHAYQENVAPGVQPSNVETPFQVACEIGDDIREPKRHFVFDGRVDLIDDTGKIIETKTSSRKVSAPKPDHVFQATAYAFGFRDETGETEAGARIDYAVGGKTAHVMSYPFEISEGKLLFLHNQVVAVARAIANDVFIPNRTSVLCSPAWCGYYRHCVRQYGE